MGHHIIHMHALKQDVSEESPDDDMSGMIESLEKGDDPFKSVRSMLSKASTLKEEYSDITF